MPRTKYRNGDTITLTSCGCDGCSPSRINGALCHEQGCLEAWKDYAKTCSECDRNYYAQRPGAFQMCHFCARNYFR